MNAELKEIVINGKVFVEKGTEFQMVKTDGMEYVIVRCRNAGVHAGYLKSRDAETLTLVNSRRLWQWHGRTLSGLALEGTDEPKKCKFGDPLPVLVLNANDWCEIIFCTESARKSIESVEIWKNN